MFDLIGVVGLLMLFLLTLSACSANSDKLQINNAVLNKIVFEFHLDKVDRYAYYVT